MTIEEYKEAILLQLEKARDCEEVEQILKQSVSRLRSKGIDRPVVDYYLEKLYDGLKELTPADFDSIHWCNIKCAITNLRKIKGKV